MPTVTCWVARPDGEEDGQPPPNAHSVQYDEEYAQTICVEEDAAVAFARSVLQEPGAVDIIAVTTWFWRAPWARRVHVAAAIVTELQYAAHVKRFEPGVTSAPMDTEQEPTVTSAAPALTIKAVELERVRQIVNAYAGPSTALPIMVTLEQGDDWIHEVPAKG